MLYKYVECMAFVRKAVRRWQNLLPGMCKAIWNPFCILPCDDGLVSHSSRAMRSTKIGSREKGAGTLLHKCVECTALL